MARQSKLTLSIAICSLMLWGVTVSPLWAVNTVAELKQTERHVQELVADVLPSTVCIQSAGGEGSGSGVVVSRKGLILTAGHVISSTGDDLEIIFPDGRKVKGTALGANLGRDAGMAKITEEGEYPYVDIGTSGGLKRNDWCVALGHAAGFDPKRTPPVRLGRVITNQHYVVTDCTLIGGDSGGPLFDMKGRLIGIHSNIGQSLAQNQHVPIDVFRRDWKRMLAGETWGDLLGDPNTDPDRPVLGVRLDPLANDDGVALTGVMPQSPAAAAGILDDDVIVKVDGHVVKAPADVMSLVQTKKVGDRVAITVKRNDKTLDFTIQLARAADVLAKLDEADEEVEEVEETEEEEREGRSIEELMKEARENGGRLELSGEELQRLERYMARRMRRPARQPPVVVEDDKWFEQLFGVYKSIIARASASTYRVLIDGEQTALATAVTNNTLVTKASEIDGETFEIEVGDREFDGEVVKRFKTYDVALVRIDEDVLTPAVLHPKDNDLPLGSFVAAVDETSEPAAIGVISVKPRDLTAAVRGYLGVVLQGFDGGIIIRQVQPSSPAQRAGLKSGDIIVKLDNKRYKTPSELADAVGKHRPGDSVVMLVQRGDEEWSIRVKIGDRDLMPAMHQSRLEMMDHLGSRLSETRSGFALALQHDCPLVPSQCGGPLVNLDGQVVGINIARAGRIKSYAIPAGVIERLLAKADQDAKTRRREPVTATR